MKPVSEGAVVRHTLYPCDDRFIGIVIDVHERFGALVGWRIFEKEQKAVRCPLKYLARIEDAATIERPVVLDAGEFGEEIDATVDAGEFSVDDPQELSVMPDQSEDDETEEQSEQSGYVIEESADSEPLPEEREDEFEEVEDV